MAVGRLEGEASERSAAWREACVAVDVAYCQWLWASPKDRPGAFAAYRAALDHEESVALSDGVVIDGRGIGSESTQVDPARSVDEGPPAARGERARVLIAEPDGFARRALERVLRERGEVGMVTFARDGREAMELVRRYDPDVLLVEIGVPPAGGVELIRKVVAELPRVRIVTVSAGAEWDQAVLAAMRAGAVGHIDKDTDPAEIARLVVLAATGEAIVPGRLMTRLRSRF